MGNLSRRIGKLEQKAGGTKRVSAVTHTIYKRGVDGPETTRAAYTTLIGVRVPRVVKSINETKEDYGGSIDGYISRVDEILTLEGEAAAQATDTLTADIEAANTVAKSKNEAFKAEQNSEH